MAVTNRDIVRAFKRGMCIIEISLSYRLRIIKIEEIIRKAMKERKR